MFLFNSLDNSGDVNSALRTASRRTGVGLDYLKTTAKRESNLDPNAKAGSSSATGLFQFIEKTWLSMLKEAGPQYGYGDLANKIEPSASGGYRVTDASARNEILKLREDPKAAALMAGEFTARNAESLRASLGRPASEGELYAAHFLGAQGATELVRLSETAPNAPAAERFPSAASANRSIFYKSGGTPRTAREVYANLVSGYDATPAVPQEGATYLAVRPGRAADDQAFHGLYRTDNAGLGPISKSVSGFWGNFGANSSAYGFSATPAVTAGRDIAAGEIVIESTAPAGGDGQGTTEVVRSQSRFGGAGRVSRGYGRFADDPSRPVR